MSVGTDTNHLEMDYGDIITYGIWNKNQLMSLFQFYLYIAGSLHVLGPEIRQYINKIEIVKSVGFYSIC